MKPILLFFLIFIGICANAQDAISLKLKQGMSDVQVKQTLGEPLKIENFTTIKNNTFDTSVYWRYANDVVVVLTNHLYERIEKSREELLKSIQQAASNKSSGGLTIVSHGKK